MTRLSDRRHFLRLAGSAAAMSGMPRLARAQAFPARPIILVVPYPPGGSADTAARILAEPVSAYLGQSLIIENAPGGSTRIGTTKLVRAAPDGYTLGIGDWNSHVASGVIFSLPYDVQTDFVPVALDQIFCSILVVNKDLPANNLQEFIAWLKANPDKASAGSSGIGSLGHLAGILFQNLTGTHFQHVPYRGNVPAMQDLLGGQIQLIFGDPSVVAQARAGRVKALVVTASHRVSAIPDVPTAQEAGLPVLTFSNWNAIVAPKNTPMRIVTQLNDAVIRALNDSEVRRKINELGSEIPSPEQQKPEAIAALQRAEIEKWWPIIRTSNVKPE